MKVKYIAPIMDPSGYGHAARGYVSALIKAGIDVTIEPMMFDVYTTDYGKMTDTIKDKINVFTDYDVQILHSTPEHWKRIVDPKKPVIGITVWETSSIPDPWVKFIQDVNPAELWLPNEFNVGVFNAQLPSVKTEIIPHVFDAADFNAIQDPLKIPQLRDDTFMFYSIFQWTERKNPFGLLSAYFSAFGAKDNVALVLKTYADNFSPTQQQRVTTWISQLKNDLGQMEFPPLYLLLDIMPFKQMVGLHRRGDCFLAPHRAEGVGLPIMEAMGMGKPVITTNWSGNTDFCSDDNSYLLNYTMTPVRGIPWCPWYNGKQLWAEPDLRDLMNKMRHVVNHKDENRVKGLRAAERIQKYNPEAIGQRMVRRLEEILK